MLELTGRTGGVNRFKPEILWIVGHKGRFDVKRGVRRRPILDAARTVGEPDRQAGRAESRCGRESVNADRLRRLLR